MATSPGPVTTGRLFVVATPIGNLEDMTLRAIEVLRSVDVIASEDTRRTRKLLSHFEIRKPLIVYHDHNEDTASSRVLGRLRDGQDVALVSDSGTPLVADPGYRLVSQAVREGVDVVPVPGPSASVAALSASGLPPQPFFFAGFLPRKAGARRRRLGELADLTCTIVFFESPHRVEKSLRDMREVLGDRPCAVARELTKFHEEILRGSLREMVELASERPLKGEIVILVGGKEPR